MQPPVLVWGGWGVPGGVPAGSSKRTRPNYDAMSACLLVKPHPLLLVAEPPRIKATPSTVQGTLAKRQMMPKEGGGFLQVADLAVGKCVRVYGR